MASLESSQEFGSDARDPLTQGSQRIVAGLEETRDLAEDGGLVPMRNDGLGPADVLERAPIKNWEILFCYGVDMVVVWFWYGIGSKLAVVWVCFSYGYHTKTIQKP